MMKKALFMLAMMACIFASCSDGGSDEPANPTPKPEEVKAEITIDNSIVTNGLSFSVAQGEQSVSFTTNTNWTLSIAATTGGSTWCKASATSGSKGTANVKFTVTENTDYDDRSVSVTIKAGTASKTFTITQKGADALLVTTKKYEVAQAGGKIEVEVKANIEYQIAVSETAKDWIKETQSKSRALTAKKHTFEIAENEEAEKREGEITVKSGDKVETVKVYQAGGAVLLLSKNEFTVSDTGETISVDIKSNVEYGVQMPDVDWIQDEASNRGMSSHTLKYVIAPNEGYDSRSAEIIFYDQNSDLKDTLKVVQAQKDAIVISKKEYEVEAEGETIEVKLSANVDFEVTMPEVDWIEQVESRALTEHTLYFKVMKNKVKEERMVEIEFTNTDSRLSEKIKITQQGIRFLQLTKDEYTVSDAGETIEVEIKSNVEYGIQMPEVDWITKDVSERSVSEETLKFIVDANETYDNRSAKIVFYDKNGDLKDTLTVIQVQKDAIILSQKEYEVKAEGETIEVKLSSNVDFEVIMPSVDWVNQMESRALTEHILYFKIEENTSEESRKTIIVFDNKEKEYSDTITIVQDKKVFSGEIITVSSPGSLPKIIGDSRKYQIKSLKIIGKINGTDLRLIREMVGRDVEGKETNGCLNTIDLSEAQIVSGGDYYYKYDNNTYCKSKDNVIGDFLFWHCSMLKRIILPKTATEIGDCVFYMCTSLKNIEIPESVTIIGGTAFSQCYSLEEIKIPKNVVKIGSSAFSNCRFETIVLPENLESIEPKTFSGSGIKSIIIPEKVKIIGEQAFSGTAITSIKLPEGLKEIGEEAFRGSLLKSISIPGNVEKMGPMAFMACSDMKEVIISEGIKRIHGSVFYNCGVKKVSLPSSLETILGGAFQTCKINEIYCAAKTAPELYNQSFDSSIFYTCKVYIPVGSLNSYKVADYWGEFSNFIETDF